MKDTIDALREMVELPLRHPELFQRLGVDPPAGVLLHGPPGTGKTRLARAVANEKATLNSSTSPGPRSWAQPMASRRSQELFDEAAKAAPSIIFIDEIDSIAPKRGQVSGEAEKRLVALPTLMDGLEPRQNLVAIAATNRPGSARRGTASPAGSTARSSAAPTSAAVAKLGIHTRHAAGRRVDLDELARRTYGFVGADLAAPTCEAALEARSTCPRLDRQGRSRLNSSTPCRSGPATSTMR